MRPNSIIKFEQLFFVGLALGAVAFFMNFDAALAQMQADPSVAAVGMGSGSLIGMYALGIAINLLLWFFIARKGKGIAKWIYVVFFAIGLIGLPALFIGGFGLIKILGLIGFAIQAYMIYLLFQPDSKAWFSKDSPSDPEVFN